MTRPQKPLKLPEFVAMLAIMISILALSIDAMLPALGDIGQELGLENPNDAQLIISTIFLGFAIGQIIAGPLSDSFGRKPIIYLGYAVFILGCILSIISTNITLMLIGRFLQGLGAAAPRIVGIALVRDGYEGRAMAQIMSMVMAIFVLVPAIAPAIGQAVLFFAHWRWIFVLLLLTAIFAFLWFSMRQPETLPVEKRRVLSIKNLFADIVEALSYRTVTGYTIAAGLIFGCLLGYLNSAQQIFQGIYNTGQWFALYFGVAALGIGIASVVNSKLVIKLGMRYLSWRSLASMTAFSCIFLVVALAYDGIPDLWMFMVWLLGTFFSFGMLFGNFNALAMERIGHMAGIGAAIIGCFSTFIGLPLGYEIGALYNGTVTPLVAGFAVLCSLTLITMWWSEQEAPQKQDQS